MGEKTVRVQVPGTSANCGPGFDTLGVACTIYNEMEVSLLEEQTLLVEAEGAGADTLPRDWRNIVWRAIDATLEKSDMKKIYKGASIKMKNNIPLSRGLGSSAAAIVAGVKAANLLLDNPFNQREMLQIATELEGHPDNVAPAIYGGFTISVMRHGKPDCFSFLPRLPLRMVVAIPEFPLSTRMARSVLPDEVPMKDAVFNVSRSALMVAALMKGNIRFLRHSFDDVLHQPYRSKLIPGMYEVFRAARREGAIGVSLSGAGPCLMAYTIENAEGIGDAMVEEFKKHEVVSQAMVLDIDKRGVRVMR